MQIPTKQRMNDLCLACDNLCCNTMIVGLEGQSGEDVQYWSTIGHTLGRACVVRMECRQLESGGCSMYDLRPKKCRDFQVDGDQCKALRKAYGEINNRDVGHTDAEVDTAGKIIPFPVQ